jgi:hypothetical protein
MVVWLLERLFAAPHYPLGTTICQASRCFPPSGRRQEITLAPESALASAFVAVAAVGVTVSPWLLVAGLAGHGFKDLWQHRYQFVAKTRWWPPFCLVVDWTVSAIIAVALLAGVQFHNYSGLGQ